MTHALHCPEEIKIIIMQPKPSSMLHHSGSHLVISSNNKIRKTAIRSIIKHPLWLLIRAKSPCNQLYLSLFLLYIQPECNKARLYVIMLPREHYHFKSMFLLEPGNQRTNGPVNAHLISWPSKAQNIQNLDNIYGKEMTLTFNTHIPL